MVGPVLITHYGGERGSGEKWINEKADKKKKPTVSTPSI
jgi:hypothetical protein